MNLGIQIVIYVIGGIVLLFIGWAIKELTKQLTKVSRIETQITSIETQINGLGQRLDQNVRELRQILERLREETLHEVQNSLHQQELRIATIETRLKMGNDPCRGGGDVESELKNVRRQMAEILTTTSLVFARLDKIEKCVCR